MIRPRAIFLVPLLALAGCKVGGPSPADQYRIEARDLRKELEQTKAENAELKTKLAQLGAAQSRPMSAAGASALPQLAKLEIGDYSGPLRDPPVNGTQIIRVYLQPADSRGRVIQITGELDAAVFAAGQDQPLGATHLAPAQLRDAYRAGFMGVYYTIDVAVDAARLPSGTALRAVVKLTDAQSGQEFKVEGPIGSSSGLPTRD